MKKIILLILSLSLCFVSCQRDDEIIGVWVRKGDEFSGLKVEVIKKGNILNGVIIYSTNATKKSGFIINDVKWKGIKNIEESNYEFEDLMKGVDYYGNIRNIEYSLARLEVENNIIRIRQYTKGIEIIGTEQIWVKEK